MTGIKYEIVEHIGVLSENNKGWKKELNLISWNEREPNYDIRDWDENHEKMGKGVTLSKDELISLSAFIDEMEK
ncbi:MAG: PC4/YdbC family ssDNA-binding protein [Alphaproteobacteria bacterium]|nr:PC4/YdbC family ssDNA-binding protein [Alphaproteobacteria bacterium]